MARSVLIAALPALGSALSLRMPSFTGHTPSSMGLTTGLGVKGEFATCGSIAFAHNSAASLLPRSTHIFLLAASGDDNEYAEGELSSGLNRDNRDTSESGFQGSPSSLAPQDMALLSARIAKIQRGDLATPAQKYFEIATSKPPQIVMAEFFMEAPPNVVNAMRDAIVSLLGALPSFQFSKEVTTTADRLAALMLQLQMTGYMLRNAQYALSLRKLLNINGRAFSDFKEAFDRLDTDGNGYLELDEVKALLAEIYGGEAPAYEAISFMKFFDANTDGRISWKEFLTALGAPDTASDQSSTSGAAQPSLPGGDAGPRPALSGTIEVMLEGGRTIEVDAADYMQELRKEVEQLKGELNNLQKNEQQKGEAMSSSLSAYVASLPEAQAKARARTNAVPHASAILGCLDAVRRHPALVWRPVRVLTQGISDDVVSAMNMVVKYILQVPGENGTRELTEKDAIKMEEGRLQQLCLYQLVLGYRLREAEAKGEAQKQLGL